MKTPEATLEDVEAEQEESEGYTWTVNYDSDISLPNGEIAHIVASATGETETDAWINLRDAFWEAIKGCISTA